MRLVHVGGCMGAPEVFKYMFDEPSLNVNNPSMLNDLKPTDIVMLGGGEDIHPSLYDQPKSRYTYCRPDKSYRDLLEKHTLDCCHIAGIPVYGICRGAQLINAYCGGILVQHVSGHHVDHDLHLLGRLKNLMNDYWEDENISVVKTNSVHHQMMFPWSSKEKFEILATSPQRSAGYCFLDNYNVLDLEAIKPKVFLEFTKKELIHIPPANQDPEVIYWPDRNWVGVQAHPEFCERKGKDLEVYKQLMNMIIDAHLEKLG